MMPFCDILFENTEKSDSGEKRMADKKRFEVVYSQGAMTVTEIWVDKETGVNYLYHACGNSGGLTPLLGRDGKPIVSPITND